MAKEQTVTEVILAERANIKTEEEKRESVQPLEGLSLIHISEPTRPY